MDEDWLAAAWVVAVALCPFAPARAAELATRGAVQCPPGAELAFRVLADAVSVALALALSAEDAPPNTEASRALPGPALPENAPQPDRSRVPAREDAPEAPSEPELARWTPVLTLALVGDSGS